jgi:hypothetical protein
LAKCLDALARWVWMKPGRRDKYLKRLERVKGIEPSYSAFACGNEQPLPGPNVPRTCIREKAAIKAKPRYAAQGGIGKRQ